MDPTSLPTLQDKDLYDFLINGPKDFHENERIKKYQLKNGDYIHCVLWNFHFYISGTDIVKILIWRFQNAGKQIGAIKKFEEGIFSDLRNLKPGVDATLEGPRSEFLEFLYKNGCIRTQKKQKVFYWYSVPHDELFFDALERDMRRDSSVYAYNRLIQEPHHMHLPEKGNKQCYAKYNGEMSNPEFSNSLFNSSTGLFNGSNSSNTSSLHPGNNASIPGGLFNGASSGSNSSLFNGAANLSNSNLFNGVAQPSSSSLFNGGANATNSGNQEFPNSLFKGSAPALNLFNGNNKMKSSSLPTNDIFNIKDALFGGGESYKNKPSNLFDAYKPKDYNKLENPDALFEENKTYNNLRHTKSIEQAKSNSQYNPSQYTGAMDESTSERERLFNDNIIQRNKKPVEKALDFDDFDLGQFDFLKERCKEHFSRKAENCEQKLFEETSKEDKLNNIDRMGEIRFIGNKDRN